MAYGLQNVRCTINWALEPVFSCKFALNPNKNTTHHWQWRRQHIILKCTVSSSAVMIVRLNLWDFSSADTNPAPGVVVTFWRCDTSKERRSTNKSVCFLEEFVSSCRPLSFHYHMCWAPTAIYKPSNQHFCCHHEAFIFSKLQYTYIQHIIRMRRRKVHLDPARTHASISYVHTHLGIEKTTRSTAK